MHGAAAARPGNVTAEKQPFASSFIVLVNMIVSGYQDRLGTNIGKALQTRVTQNVFFAAGMGWPQQAERILGMEGINLGFSGNGAAGRKENEKRRGLCFFPRVLFVPSLSWQIIAFFFLHVKTAN